MKKIDKLNCPACGTKFIPRTSHPEEITYSNHSNGRVATYSYFFGKKGIKPPEVVLETWITYCPNCNYILKFVKELAKQEKIFLWNAGRVELKYKNYDFEKHFVHYSQYLKDITEKIKEQINFTLNELNITDWESMYEIEDDFKFLVRFIANLENYYEIQLGKNKEKKMPIKIKELGFPTELEKNLLDLNTLRNDIVHEGYELTVKDQNNIKDAYFKFIFYLIDKNIKLLIDKTRLDEGYDFIDINDIYSEIKLFLSKHFYEAFPGNTSVYNKVKEYIANLFKDK